MHVIEVGHSVLNLCGISLRNPFKKPSEVAYNSDYIFQIFLPIQLWLQRIISWEDERVGNNLIVPVGMAFFIFHKDSRRWSMYESLLKSRKIREIRS